jgi:hypothetical protein
VLRLSTLVLLHLLIQNGIFHPTHSYSLLHIHYSRICIPSYLSFMAHTKLGWDPRTQECTNTECANVQVWNAIHERGDKKSPKDCSRLKSCEFLYTCPCAPFYRETKGLLRSENTLKSKEYSWCEHVHECLYIPWFAVLISYIYKSAPSSHAKLGLLKLRLWLGIPQIPESSIHNSRISEIWTRNFTGPWFQASAISCLQTSARIVHPETDWEFKHKGLVRPLFFMFLRKLVQHPRLVKILNFTVFFMKLNLFPTAVSRICLMNFDTPTFP